MMMLSGIPASLAEVAAPILKLWVLYSPLLMRKLARMLSSELLNKSRVSLLPSPRINRGPSRLPLTTKYGKSASTGQSCESVFPKHKVTPCLKGSVFDCLMFTLSIRGLALLSTATSFTERCTSGSYVAALRRDSEFNTAEKSKAACCPHHDIVIAVWAFQ